MKIFDKNNIDHIRCVRDVEMEIRFNDPSHFFKRDEYNDIRQYVRDVLVNRTEQNADVVEVYESLVNLIGNLL